MPRPYVAKPGELAWHLMFVSTPALWPVWPFLPLVRRSAGDEEMGLMFDVLRKTGLTGYSATVFLCNLFDRPDELHELLALPREVFDTAEEVLQAGWRVE